MRAAAIVGHAPAASRMRSLARENAATRRSIGAWRAGKAGGSRSSTATVSLCAWRCEARASSAATQAPTGPPPTTRTSSSSATGAQSAQVEPTRKARRWSPEARAHARKRALRRRHQIKQQQPEVAQHANAAPPVPEELDEAVGKANHAASIARAPVGKLPQQRCTAPILAICGEELGEHRAIAQTEIEALAGNWVQCLCRVANERTALTDACQRAGEREVI